MLTACNRPHNGWSALYSDARSKFQSGDISAALTEAEEGLLKSRASDPVWNYKFRILKAEILIWQSKNEESLALLDVEPPVELSQGEFAVRRKSAQGRALYRIERLAEAREKLNDAHRLAASGAPELLSRITLDEGNLASLEKDYAAAGRYFHETVRLARQNKQPLMEASALGSLGLLSTQLEHYDEAIDWLEQSLTLVRASHARNVEAITLGNLGWSYLELGDFEKALPLFQDAEKLAADMGLRTQQQSSLNNLARIHSSQGSYSQATGSYLKALDLAKDLKDEVAVSDCLDNLALVALRQDRLKEAEEYNRQASVIPRARENGLVIQLTAARIADAKKDFARAKPILLQVIRTAEHKSVRWQAESELANLYVAQGKPELATRQFEATLATLGDVRSSLKHDDSKLAFVSQEASFYGNYIDFLISQRQPDKALQVAELSRARTLSDGLGFPVLSRPQEIRLQSAQKYLGESKKVALDYWLGPKRSYLWVITPGQISLFNLPAKAEIDQLVQSYSRNILSGQDSSTSPGNEGQKLYQILVQPAEKLIPRGSSVVIIPDGSLARLNFETLVVPGARQHYWIEDTELESASSMTLLASSTRQRPRNAKDLLLMGDAVQANPDFGVLKYAGNEVRQVAAHFTQPRVVTGKDATPSAYAANSPGDFRYIHLVTHGTASQLSPLESAVILSPEGENSYKLYAREIVKTQLHAELVTISACRGAGTREYSGEGLVGLGWAFLRAGAHQVVAGLWEVNDLSTPQLMDHFYAELQKGRSASAALRTAKLAMLRSDTVYRHPFFWGSMQLYTGP